MGAGASTGDAPYSSADDAIAAGKTQEEVDAWIAANPPKAQDEPAADATAADADTKAQDDAATKLQAIQRGKTDRGKVEEKKEAIAQDGAATKMQAIQRGRADRGKVEEKKEAIAQDGAATKMQAIQRGRADKAKVDAIKGLFDKCDKNADGEVTKREIIQALAKDEGDGLRAALGLPNPKDSDGTKEGKHHAVWAFKDALVAFFGGADADQDGKLSPKEFSDFLTKHVSTQRNLAKLDAAQPATRRTSNAGDLAVPAKAAATEAAATEATATEATATGEQTVAGDLAGTAVPEAKADAGA